MRISKTNIKKQKGKIFTLGLCFSLIISPLFFLANHNKNNNFIAAEAADYSGGGSGFSRDSSGSVTAKFTVTNNTLDMKGWLLCLFESKPSVDSNNKLNGSNDIHPYSYSNCKHYFFSSNTSKTGEMNVKWDYNAVDQKSNWTSSATTTSTTGQRMCDYFDNGTNWHIVVGPRHYNTSWGDSGIGAGTGGYWENCDYYIGQRSEVFPTQKDMSVTVTPVTKTYNGASSSLGIKVKDPSSGYTIKYRTASSGSYNLTTNPQYKDAGEYITYFQITSSGYKTYEGSGKVTINKATPSYSLSPASELEYNGNNQKLISSASSNLLFSLDNTNYSSNIPTGKNAGKYTIYYKIEESKNYTSLGPKTLDVYIAKADHSYTKPTAKGYLVYSNSYQYLVNAGSCSTGTLLYSLDGKNYSSDVPMAKDAGTYTIHYKIDENENYKAVSDKTIVITIAKATPSYLAPIGKENLVYNGNEMELINKGSDNILYSLDNINYSSDVPKATNAGTYVVYYKINETDNYEGIGPITIEVVIAKADPIYTAPEAKTNLVYDTTNQNLVKAGSSNILYSLDGINYSSNVPTGNNAGTYTIYYKIDETDNYKGLAAKTIVVNIAKAVPTYTSPVAKTNLIYNESNQDLIIPGSCLTGTILYSLDGTNYSSDTPVGKNAGTYTVFYKIEETPNYKPVDVKTIEVTIQKAQATYINLPTKIEGLHYTANEQVLINAGSCKGGHIEYSLDGTNYSTNIPSKTLVDTYTIYYKIVGDSNYIGVDSQSFTVSIYENDKTVLNAVINDANTYKEDISSSYLDIANTLEEAINDAQLVSNNPNKTVTEISDAKEDLLHAIDVAKAAVVDTLIKNIGDVRYIESCFNDIKDALDAYDLLSEDQKQLVNNYQTLLDARDLYNKLKAVVEVIDAIGNITYDDSCYNRILEAINAFNSLNEEEKLLLPTYFNDLNSAQDIYNMLKIIANLGDVSYSKSFKQALDNARNIFDALDLNEQQAIYNYQDLVDKENIYKHIDQVVNLVNNIDEELEYVGTHNTDIDKARHAYESLSEEEKALVPEETLTLLENKEEEYQELKIEHEKREAEDREAGVAIAIEGASGIPDTVSIDINSSNDSEEDFTNNVDYQTISETIAEDEQISSMVEISLHENVEGEDQEISLNDIDEGLSITIRINLPNDVDEENFKVILLDGDNNIIDLEYTYDSANRVVIVTTNRTGTFAIVSTNTHAVAKTNDLPLAIILASVTTLVIATVGYFYIKEKRKNG